MKYMITGSIHRCLLLLFSQSSFIQLAKLAAKSCTNTVFGDQHYIYNTPFMLSLFCDNLWQCFDCKNKEPRKEAHLFTIN
jgi:surface polysaccharide O-acyltransferase-like enzyme